MTMLKALLSLLSAIAGWFKDKQLIDAGKAQQRAEDQQKTIEVKNEQAKIAVDRPVDRDDLVKRLRDPKRDLSVPGS